MDTTPAAGDNFYRIRSIDQNGTAMYSKVVKVTVANLKGSISVNQNPVSGGNINLQLKNMPAGKYSVRLLNTLGQVILSNLISHPGGISTKTISFPQEMSKGIYNLEVTNNTNTSTIIKVVY